VAHFEPRYTWRKTSGIIEEVWSNLPGGEIFTFPARVDGVFVVDGTVGDHFGEKYGVLDRTPMTLEIEDSRLRSARCPNRDLEREFWEYCHQVEGSDRVGEFAIGTNLAVFEFTGNLLQDEKMPGIHIAFGTQTGADWSCTTHVDVITRSCDIWIDSEQVMQHGIFVSDKLGIDYTYLSEDPSVMPMYAADPEWKRLREGP
jgi:leucyl aminopeptidase (aminopeptidase T)